MYTVLLLAHSWLRWAVLAAALGAGVRAVRARARGATWTERDDRMWSVLVGLAGVQLLVGLTLVMWASPVARAAWSGGIRVMLEQPTLLIFGILHPVGLVIAVGALHSGRARIRRLAAEQSPDSARFAVALRSVAGFLIIAAVTIPWPFLPWGRPLARFGSGAAARAAPVEPPAAYRARCVACHGDTGRGDGPAAAGLVPRPRSFADSAWQRATSDERLRTVMLGGGMAIGKSPLMPAHRDLGEAELSALIEFIRRCNDAQPRMSTFLTSKRPGPRPRTTPTNPHMQLDQNAPRDLQEQLFAIAEQLPGVRIGASFVSVPGARAFHLPACTHTTRGAFMIEREFGHLHPPSDGSLHMTLPPDVVDTVITNGWAERHPIAGKHGLPSNIVMVYGPRDAAELDVVADLVRASHAYACGAATDGH